MKFRMQVTIAFFSIVTNFFSIGAWAEHRCDIKCVYQGLEGKRYKVIADQPLFNDWEPSVSAAEIACHRANLGTFVEILYQSCKNRDSQVIPPTPAENRYCCGVVSCNQTCPTSVPGCWPGGGTFEFATCGYASAATSLCKSAGSYVTSGYFASCE